MDTHHQTVSAQFPSRGHLASLRQNLRKTGGGTLSVPDLWLWHAYVYGFRRVALNDYQPVSPIDAMGEWFHGELVEAAEAFYKRFLGRSRNEYIPPTHRPPE